MSFVYCKTCDWEQDDFWHEGYTPFLPNWASFYGDLTLQIANGEKWIRMNTRSAEEMNRYCREMGLPGIKSRPILEDEKLVINGELVLVNGNPENPGNSWRSEVDIKDYLSYLLRRKALRIDNMHWMNRDEWVADPNRWICPICKAKDIHED